MDDTKPWYTSKTIWSGVVVAGASLLGLFGYQVGLADQATATDDIVMVVTGLGGLAAIIGRIFVKTQVTVKK